MRICGKEISDETISQIRDIIAENWQKSRAQLSRQICETLEWRSPNGMLKDVSCRVVLLRLHRKGRIQLPEAQKRRCSRVQKGSTRKQKAVGEGVGGELSELGEIRIIKVDRGDRKRYREWKEMMDEYHYLGSGPLCGYQMKYLIESEGYGSVGGFAFSAAAWRLEDRERWIGWDERRRQENLSKVVCNSRFLIVPWVRVKNLASQVLSACIRRLREDWYEQYKIKPVLLETFVERERFRGSSYRASNWVHIGGTKGRGRQDRCNEYRESIKDIYVYPLDKDFREELCKGMPEKVVKREEEGDWAEEEFSRAELGDERRVERLITVARDFYSRPQSNIPQACGSRAKTKAAYRFLESKSTTMEKIQKSHYEATVNRIGKEKIVLAVQDTTTLNYSTHPATADLGLIGSKAGGLVGLIVHDTMTFNVEGTPLGVIDVQCWARDPEDFGKKHLRHKLRIEQKESNKWLKSFHVATEVQRRCPETTVVSVGDREADIYELFHLALSKAENPKLLVRAEHNRLLVDGQGHLYEYLQRKEVSGVQTVRVPRKQGRPAREAKLEVRFTEVTLRPPQGKEELGELSIWAVYVRETEVPDGVEALEWMLLTTCEVKTFEQAVEKLQWYCLRWGIEIYHRVLKSGCRIEQRQLGSAERIENCLAIDIVVAWRIYHLTKLGREMPNMPCTVFFEDAEWKALVAYKTQNPIPPENPPTLREAIHMVASLGGFLGRKCDGEPGTQTLWLGLQRLEDITEMWKISMSVLAPHLFHPPPVSSIKCG